MNESPFFPCSSTPNTILVMRNREVQALASNSTLSTDFFRSLYLLQEPGFHKEIHPWGIYTSGIFLPSHSGGKKKPAGS